MLQNRRMVSGICWFVAGLPILASFVQASVALLGASASGVPVIGGLKRLLQSLAVFDAAGTIFRSSSAIVLLLFVLVTVAWLAQGVGLFVLRRRTFTLGATGLVTLFLILFELVYLPLFSMDVPAAQVAGFALVPVVSAAASWGASLVFEWDVTLDEETGEKLSAAREDAQTARSAFDERVSDRVPQQARESLESTVPDAVAAFEEGCTAFREECDDVVDRAEQLADEQASLSSRERNDRAEQVAADAAALDPEARARQLTDDLQSAVLAAVRDEFDDLHRVSRYGRAYEMRNLQTFNEVSLPTIGGPPVQVGGRQHELADRLAEAVESDGLAAAAPAIERSRDHVAELDEFLDERESEVAAVVDEADDVVDGARDHLDAVDGRARERLTEILFEGRTPEEIESVPTVPDVREKQEAARDGLHAGRFDEARRAAETALDDARAVEEIVEFFADSVVATIDYGSGSIPIPPTVGSALATQLRVPFERAYGVEYAVENGELVVAADTEDTGPAGDDREPIQQSTDGGDVRTDDVLYVFRELTSTAAATSAENAVELQTEQVPEKFVRPEILDEVRDFAERQGAVDGVDVDADVPPGYLSIRVTDDASPQQVMSDLQDQYASTQQ